MVLAAIWRSLILIVWHELAVFVEVTCDVINLVYKFQVNLLSQFLNDNLAEPIELLWLAHDRIFHREDGPKCAESLLCHLNFRIKSRGSKLKIGFAKAISIFASW